MFSAFHRIQTVLLHGTMIIQLTTQIVLVSNPKHFIRENFISTENLTADTFSLHLQNISSFNNCARKYSVLFLLGSSNLLSAGAESMAVNRVFDISFQVSKKLQIFTKGSLCSFVSNYFLFCQFKLEASCYRNYL